MVREIFKKNFPKVDTDTKLSSDAQDKSGRHVRDTENEASFTIPTGMEEPAPPRYKAPGLGRKK
jgi:hypothetical protein